MKHQGSKKVIMSSIMSFSLLMASHARAQVPTNLEEYQALAACEKQSILWNNVTSTKYENLPQMNSFGLWQLLRLGAQELFNKFSLDTDFSPKGWKKYLHRRGVVAKVKFVPQLNSYSGLFQGAPCGILRLSLTFRPSGKKPVSPGLALKLLRDQMPSGNISALVSLNGQGRDFNFFKNRLSNIVPKEKGFGRKMVHKIFKKFSKYPEELLTIGLANASHFGEQSDRIVSPVLIFFVPNPNLKFSEEEHDIRDDILSLPSDTNIYEVRAVSQQMISQKYPDFNFDEYTEEMISRLFITSEPVGDLVTTSEFLASKFGDDGIFFRHHLR